MPLKTNAELGLEIDQAVNPAGGLPLITGPALNTVLKSLATELTALPAATAGQLDALAATLQGQVLVQSAATGARTYCPSWEAAHAVAQAGDVVTFGPGTFGDPTRTAFIQKDLEVRLHAATTWQFSTLYLHTVYQATRRRVHLVGEGCLQGTIMWYGDLPLDVELRHVRHEGVLVHNAYLTLDSIGNQLLLDGVRFAAPAGADYLTAFTRYGGYYMKPLAATVRGCQGTVPSGAFYHNTGSGGNPSDAAGNLLCIQNSHLACAPGQPLVLAPDGVVTYDFAQVSYSGTLPANVLAANQYQFLGLPAAGAAPAAAPGLEVVAVAAIGGRVGANGFNPVPGCDPRLDVRPAGLPGGWNTSTGEYVAPLAGVYELHVRVRINDPDGPVGASYGLGAGPANTDGEWVLWNTIFSVNTPYNRKGNQTVRVLHLAAGQAVHAYVYLDSFDADLGGELTVKLLRRDD